MTSGYKLAAMRLNKELSEAMRQSEWDLYSRNGMTSASECDK